MKKGQELELEIESLAFGAEGVGRADGLAVFVRGALPKQRVRVRIFKKRKSFAKARLLEVLQQSPDAVEAVCEHFEDCGGCALQHLDYEKQLEAKTSQVRETLERIGQFTDPVVFPAIGSPKRFFYRNKMEFTFGRKRWIPQAEADTDAEIAKIDFALGLHTPGRFDKILAVNACHLQSELSNRILRAISEHVQKSEFAPYSTEDHKGFWRFLVIREGKNTAQTMVNLVTAPNRNGSAEEVAVLAQTLVAKFPEITTFVQTINRLKAQVATGQDTIALQGPGFIEEKLGDFRFRVSPESFFQTNTVGGEVLYQVAEAFAELSGDETLYDLYCGAGSIGIFLSKKIQKLVGVEIVPSAIADARENAALNGLTNAHFIAGDLKDEIEDSEKLIAEHGEPDVIVLDPPRAGLHPKVVDRAAAFDAPKIVYVSCNPATFARDAQLFSEAGYRLAKSQPVDMFPHTPHIEVVSLLVKN